MKSKFLSVIVSIFALVFGSVGGAFAITYITLPETEELILGEEIFYSYNSVSGVSTVPLTGEEGELSVHFLELGNKYTGDCTYIRYGNTDILIDCGSKSSSISYVSNYLKSYMKDDVIDYCIVTHAHTDHYAGFATSGKVQSLFDLFTYGTIIDFGGATNKNPTEGVLKKYITKRDTAIVRDNAEYVDVSTEVTQGNNKVYSIGESGEVKLEILYNYYYDHDISGTENNFSVCVLLQYEGKEFLFTGDLEEHGSEGETKLLQYNESLQAIKNNGEDFGVEVYKAGHHGSKTSSSEAFIDAIRPEIVCVCCCAGSEEYTTNIDNQFPTQQFINIIAKYTSNVYITTLCVDWEKDEFTSMNGNIVVVLNQNGNFGVNCSNNNIVLKETEWFNRKIIVNGEERQMRVWPTY